MHSAKTKKLVSVGDVRQTVWPWDAPAPIARQRPLWRRVLIQLAVMSVLAGLFFLFGHVVMTWIIMGLLVCFAMLAAVAPRAYAGQEAFFARFALKVGVLLTYLLLLPFYWICFIPARILLFVRRKDPLHLAFPAPEASCWRLRPPPRGARSYERQY